MKKLRKLITELENRIAKMDVRNETVSKSAVGWHIEHALLTLHLIIHAVKNSDPKQYAWKFNFWKTIVFALNKIPRGKAKAPKVVQPKEDFTIDTLRTRLHTVKDSLNELSIAHPDKYFDHPYFGKLNVKPTIKFLGIHTKHHLKIIGDILKAEERKK